MSKDERARLLLEIIGDISDEYITKADTAEKRIIEREMTRNNALSKRMVTRIVPTVGLICAAVFIAAVIIAVPQLNRKLNTEDKAMMSGNGNGAYLQEAEWANGEKDNDDGVMYDNASGNIIGGTTTAGSTTAECCETVKTETDAATCAPAELQTTVEATWAVPPEWDETPIYNKFASFNYNGAVYGTTGVEYADRTGDFGLASNLGIAELTGYDVYADTFHEASADIYSLAKISDECILVLNFTEPPNDEYYLYQNVSYVPDTLGQFMEDLAFDECLVAEEIYMPSMVESNTERGMYEKKADGTVLLSLLHEYDDAINVNKGGIYYSDEVMDIISEREIFGVVVRFPSFDFGGRTIWITESGYLVANILDSVKAFYLGMESAFDFMEAMLGQKVNRQEIQYMIDIKRRGPQHNEGGGPTTAPPYYETMTTSNCTTAPAYPGGDGTYETTADGVPTTSAAYPGGDGTYETTTGYPR